MWYVWTEEKCLQESGVKPQGQLSLGRSGRIILKWFLEKQGGIGITFTSLKTQVEGCFKHGDEPSYSIKCG